VQHAPGITGQVEGCGWLVLLRRTGTGWGRCLLCR
jgi:hypothetical protein